MNKKTLLLIWRDDKSRLYFHVGTLTYDGCMYQFEYTHGIKEERKVHDAINYGYSLHRAFPDLIKKYKSKKMFPTFARRIPSPNRIDYDDILKELSLQEDADQMDILRATRGMIGKSPYFFAEPLYLINDNILTNHFYISGMRYSKLPNNWHLLVQKGDELILERDFENRYDSHAVKVLTKESTHLGYVPGVFSKAISVLLDKNIETHVYIDEVNSNYTPQWWIRVSFKSILVRDQSTEDIMELKGLVMPAA